MPFPGQGDYPEKIQINNTSVVYQSPLIEKAPGILRLKDGSDLMECIIQATPEPEIVWKKGGEEIEAGDKYEMKLKAVCSKYKCTLRIKNPVKEDQGVYMIVASNQYGVMRKTQNYVVSCVSDSIYR